MAAAKPGYYEHGHLDHVAPVVAVHSAPAIVAAPILEKVIAPVAVPAAVSHTYRKDIISEPVVATYAAHAVPVVAKTVVAAPYASYYGHAGGYAGLHGGLHGGFYDGIHGLHGLNGLHGYDGLHGHDGLHGLHGLHGYGHHW